MPELIATSLMLPTIPSTIRNVSKEHYAKCREYLCGTCDETVTWEQQVIICETCDQ